MQLLGQLFLSKVFLPAQCFQKTSNILLFHLEPPFIKRIAQSARSEHDAKREKPCFAVDKFVQKVILRSQRVQLRLQLCQRIADG